MACSATIFGTVRKPMWALFFAKLPLGQRPADCSLTSEMGQLRTLATYRCHVCFQGYSGRKRRESGHAGCNVSC